jgi:hypothetical protein
MKVQVLILPARVSDAQSIQATATSCTAAGQTADFHRVYSEADNPSEVAAKCLCSLVADVAGGSNASLIVSGEAADEDVKQPFARAVAVSAASQLFAIISDVAAAFPDEPTSYTVRVSMYTLAAEAGAEKITDALALAAGLGAAAGDGGMFGPGGRLDMSYSGVSEGVSASGGLVLSPRKAAGGARMLVPTAGEGTADASLGSTVSFISLPASPNRANGRMLGSDIDYDRVGAGSVSAAAGQRSAALAAASVAASGLHLRADPTFGSACVPGLWEVECEGALDVSDLLASANAPAGVRCHAVILLTLHSRRQEVVNNPVTGAIEETSVDSFSRLSIIRLARASGRSASAPIPHWVLSLSSVLTGVEQHAPSIPFASSRATLLLKDPLSGRCPAVFLALVPNVPTLGLATIQFAARVQAAAATLATAVAIASRSPSTRPAAAVSSPSRIAARSPQRVLVPGPQEASPAVGRRHGHAATAVTSAGPRSPRSVENAAAAAMARYNSRQKERASEAHVAASNAVNARFADLEASSLVDLLPTSPFNAGADEEEPRGGGRGDRRYVSFSESVRVDFYTPPDPRGEPQGDSDEGGEEEEEEGEEEDVPRDLRPQLSGISSPAQPELSSLVGGMGLEELTNSFMGHRAGAMPLASPTGRSGVDLAAVSADLATTSRALFSSTLTALATSRTEVAELRERVAELEATRASALQELGARREADEAAREEVAAGLDEAATFTGTARKGGPRGTATSKAREALASSRSGKAGQARPPLPLGPSSFPNAGVGDMSLPDYADPEVASLRAQVAKLSESNKALSRTARDFELYREVMEASIGRLQRDVQRVAEERDTALKAARTSAAAASKDRQILGNARRRVAELEALAVALEEQAIGQDSSVRAVGALRTALKEARAVSANAESSYAILREETGGVMAGLRAALTDAEAAAKREHVRAEELAGEVELARAKLAQGGEGLRLSFSSSGAGESFVGGSDAALRAALSTPAPSPSTGLFVMRATAPVSARSARAPLPPARPSTAGRTASPANDTDAALFASATAMAAEVGAAVRSGSAKRPAGRFPPPTGYSAPRGPTPLKRR